MGGAAPLYAPLYFSERQQTQRGYRRPGFIQPSAWKECFLRSSFARSRMPRSERATIFRMNVRRGEPSRLDCDVAVAPQTLPTVRPMASAWANESGKDLPRA